MEAQLEQIREQQKATWNRFSSGWKKWDTFTMGWLKPMGDEIIRSLRLSSADTVLDIAAGTGEPGLTIAPLVPHGKVVLTDLSENMLAVARENAASKGLANVETAVCDVCALPFADATFDAVSCRFGFMFFPDMLLAAQEMFRVLKPGGRMATSVWGTPDKNPWVTAIMGTIQQNMQLPPPPIGAPGMFRCGNPGFLAGLLEKAGFQNVSEKEMTGTLNCGSSENYWCFMTEVAAPVVTALSQADEPMRDKIRREVLALVDEQYPDRKAPIDYQARVVYAEKP